MKSFCVCLFLIPALFFCGCKQQNTEYIQYDSFIEVLPLVSEKVEVPPVLLYPRAVFLTDNNLVVLNEKTDTLFQVFSFPNLKYECQLGIIGDGPKDFVLPHIYPVEYNKEGFTLSDLTFLKKIRIMDNKLEVNTFKLPQNQPYYNGLVKLSDSLYCCRSGLESEYELSYLYTDGVIKGIGEFPEEVSPHFDNTLQRNEAYIGLHVSHPSGGLMALFYQHLRRWRLYNSDGVLVSDCMLTIEPGKNIPMAEDENRYIHPIATYATDDYIYTLNLDMTSDEIVRQVRTPNIQVFDWTGKPIRQYLLDCFISSFVVDEDNGAIYGVFVEDVDHIYKFSLK